MKTFILFGMLALASSGQANNKICNESFVLGQLSAPVSSLLAEHRQEKPKIYEAARLSFEGVGNKDVYNISSEFKTKVMGRTQNIILGRVEPRENHESEVWFFTGKEGSSVFSAVPNAPKFKMEDPFYTFINDELFVGGVETFVKDEAGNLGYRTVFYRDGGRGIEHLTRFLVGPTGMKDIRFAQRSDGKIQVVARPQNEKSELGGRGKNSFLTVENINDLTAEKIQNAVIAQEQVAARDWIGTNEIHMLPGGRIGYLSHVAYFKDAELKDRGYYISVYTSDNLAPKIILERNDLPGGLRNAIARNASKRPDLVDVLFSGGIKPLGNGKAYLYVGAGDAEAWRILIDWPF